MHETSASLVSLGSWGGRACCADGAHSVARLPLPHTQWEVHNRLGCAGSRPLSRNSRDGSKNRRDERKESDVRYTTSSGIHLPERQADFATGFAAVDVASPLPFSAVTDVATDPPYIHESARFADPVRAVRLWCKSSDPLLPGVLVAAHTCLSHFHVRKRYPSMFLALAISIAISAAR
jgi:hypothetical protein